MAVRQRSVRLLCSAASQMLVDGETGDLSLKMLLLLAAGNP
jgi:hypothetical protein